MFCVQAKRQFTRHHPWKYLTLIRRLISPKDQSAKHDLISEENKEIETWTDHVPPPPPHHPRSPASALVKPGATCHHILACSADTGPYVVPQPNVDYFWKFLF